MRRWRLRRCLTSAPLRFLERSPLPYLLKPRLFAWTSLTSRRPCATSSHEQTLRQLFNTFRQQRKQESSPVPTVWGSTTTWGSVALDISLLYRCSQNHCKDLPLRCCEVHAATDMVDKRCTGDRADVRERETEHLFGHRVGSVAAALQRSR
jgi:hypothetical protein